MVNAMRVTTLLVTFNRLELLKKSLENIMRQSEKTDNLIIVNNNSSDGTLDYLCDKYNLSEVKSSLSLDVCDYKLYHGVSNEINFHLISLSENTGGSGGFYSGVKYFNESLNDDYVWGMDDDAFPDKYALENLKNTIDNTQNEVCAYWSNCDLDENGFIDGIKYVSSWMFVGFAISRSLIEKIGYPKMDYFIYHDDSEYATRIIRNGYKIIKIKNSVISHRTTAVLNYWTSTLSNSIRFPEMSDMKLYYFFRNQLLKSNYSLLIFLTEFISVLKSFIQLSLTNPSKLYIAARAIFHGVKGVHGRKHV